MRPLLLLFIIVPIVEMWLLIEVGSLIGALPTIGLVLFTAVIGLALLRREGLSTLMRGRSKLDQGELPAQEIVEGLMLAVSGALLITPGFFTDFVGFMGLLPFTRQWLAKRLISSGAIQGFGYAGSPFSQESPSKNGNIIEGEYYQGQDDNNK